MPRRRRSPQWVRNYNDRALHGLALRLMKMGTTQDLSASQEWLWDACVSELEWRRAHHPRPQWACACMLCIPPFPDG